MNKVSETIQFLAHFNSWRRGDETIEQPKPSEIGAAIDDAVNLLRKYKSTATALVQLTGAVESVICDSEGAVAHIFERNPGFDKCRLQIALDRARQVCAAISITKDSNE